MMERHSGRRKQPNMFMLFPAWSLVGAELAVRVADDGPPPFAAATGRPRWSRGVTTRVRRTIARIALRIGADACAIPCVCPLPHLPATHLGHSGSPFSGARRAGEVDGGFSDTLSSASPVSRLMVPWRAPRRYLPHSAEGTERISGLGAGGTAIGNGVPKLQPVIVQSGSVVLAAGACVRRRDQAVGIALVGNGRSSDPPHPPGVGPSGAAECPPPTFNPPQERS